MSGGGGGNGGGDEWLWVILTLAMENEELRTKLTPHPLTPPSSHRMHANLTLTDDGPVVIFGLDFGPGARVHTTHTLLRLRTQHTHTHTRVAFLTIVLSCAH